LGRGDAVAAMVSNRVEFATVLAAALRTGLRFTPINWHLTADEAGYIVDNCEARAFVADARFADVAASATATAPNATGRLAIVGEDGADIDDPVLGGTMPYTSGTTGRPKGVYRPGPPPRTAVPSFGYEPGESLHLCTGPLYHTAPLAFSLVGPLNAGAGIVCM